MENKNKNCTISNINYTSTENFYSRRSVIAWFFIGGIIGFIIWVFFLNESDLSDDTLVTLLIFSTLSSAMIFTIVIASINSENAKKRAVFLKLCEDEIEKIKATGISYMSLTADLKGITINSDKQIVTIYKGLSRNPVEIPYKNILSFELVEDGSQQIQGKGAETYLAGRYLGANAALAVASSARDINTFCNQLQIEIHSTDIQKENIVIDLISNASVNKETEDYKILKSFSKNIIVTLDKIMREVENENKPKETKVTKNEVIEEKEVEKETKQSSESQKYDDLIKLKELLDKDIITKKEFDEEKKKILGK